MSLIDRRTRHAGFTLLEVLITVVIVGILAAIALPAYTDQIMRGKIVDGTTKLGDVRAQLEKYFLDNRTYVGGCAAVIPAAVGSDAFTITCPTETATTYLLQADGIAGKGMAGFTYTVDQTGTKATTGLPSGWTSPSANCWSIRKDGACQ